MDAKTSPPELSIVCPVHNEESGLDEFFDRLSAALETVTDSYEIIAVDDGSTDNTLSTLLQLQETHPNLQVIELTRNFGKESALTCGIDSAAGDAVIPIDSDLQDPPELIPEMVKLWREGYEVVLAQRSDRSTDGLLKRKSAQWFYRLHNSIADTPIPSDVGDFRLMDRKVVDALKTLPERRRFMKGLFAWVGFRQAVVRYARERRFNGNSKFSGWRLWNLALEGITSFSTVPLRIWTYAGVLVALLAAAFGLFILGRVVFFGRDVPGYASLITVILFLGSIQLVGLGILGEYIGRIYSEVKLRPNYIIRQIHSK